MWSPLPVLVSEFWCCFALSFPFYFWFGLGCRVATFEALEIFMNTLITPTCASLIASEISLSLSSS